jgi:hypothetical protein
MNRPYCHTCGEELSFPLRRGLRVYCFTCAPAEAKPNGRWVPGTPVDNRAGWVKRLDKNAKVLA